MCDVEETEPSGTLRDRLIAAGHLIPLGVRGVYGRSGAMEHVIERFAVSIQDSQLLLFAFIGASAAGVFFGGPIGDRFGTKFVIWFSILGVLPFTLALPYADFTWTIILSIVIGFIFSAAFPAIVVFAQELMPGRVGMIAGIFFGFAFGSGGIAAAALGAIADVSGVEYVFWLCSFLPLLGLLTIFLPKMRRA